VPEELLWINPDCGLKTRGKEETILQFKKYGAGRKRVNKFRINPMLISLSQKYLDLLITRW